MSALDTRPHTVPTGSTAAAAAERRRIERDLHDGAQTLLVSMRLKLGLAAERAAELDSDLHRLLMEVGTEAQAALDGVRTIAHGVYPPLLATRGLAAALAAEGDRAALPVRVLGLVPRSTPEHESAVYFCCLEALQNAAKHAGRDARATVRLAYSGGALAFEVLDDGLGSAAARPRPAHGGLAHMCDRIEDDGGQLKVHSVPGHGTSVGGHVPWPERESRP